MDFKMDFIKTDFVKMKEKDFEKFWIKFSFDFHGVRRDIEHSSNTNDRQFVNFKIKSIVLA